MWSTSWILDYVFRRDEAASASRIVPAPGKSILGVARPPAYPIPKDTGMRRRKSHEVPQLFDQSSAQGHTGPITRRETNMRLKLILLAVLALSWGCLRWQ